MCWGDERIADAVKEEGKANEAWQALLALSGLRLGVGPHAVMKAWVKRPLLQRIGLQFTLKGTGFATEALLPDGGIGIETSASLHGLWNAAGRPRH